MFKEIFLVSRLVQSDAVLNNENLLKSCKYLPKWAHNFDKLKDALEMAQDFFKILPKWLCFAKSGHIVHHKGRGDSVTKKCFQQM